MSEQDELFITAQSAIAHTRQSYGAVTHRSEEDLDAIEYTLCDLMEEGIVEIDTDDIQRVMQIVEAKLRRESGEYTISL